MTILQAALKATLIESAREYLSSGISIVPLKGKKCALHSWQMAQQYRASTKVLEQWQKDGLLHGVGVVCGAVSGNLVVLDFDSHEAVSEFERVFPDLTDTYVVSSGSRRGAHFYYYSKELPPSTLVRDYELRANGMYVVAPPSIHPVSGLAYEVQRRREPMRLDNMRPVVQWVKSKRPAREPLHVQMSEVAAPHRSSLSREEFFKERYLNAARTRQFGILANTGEGNRNTQLYISALALGQLVAGAGLNRFQVEADLLSIARRIGLEENESIKTIQSGIKVGEQRPRQCPPPPAHKQQN